MTGSADQDVVSLRSFPAQALPGHFSPLTIRDSCSSLAAARGGELACSDERDLASLGRIAGLYPELYSQKRLREWRQLFHDQAVMIRLKHGLEPHVQGIDAALIEQLEYAEANRIFVETWENLEIRVYGNTATISASYRLEADSEVRQGVDLVTLARAIGQSTGVDLQSWKIISLVYEEFDCIERRP